jgi:hypothetical protein
MFALRMFRLPYRSLASVFIYTEQRSIAHNDPARSCVYSRSNTVPTTSLSMAPGGPHILITIPILSLSHLAYTQPHTSYHQNTFSILLYSYTRAVALARYYLTFELLAHASLGGIKVVIIVILDQRVKKQSLCRPPKCPCTPKSNHPISHQNKTTATQTRCNPYIT